MYSAIFSKCQGYSHKKYGIDCEDFGLVFQNQDIYIFIVADGHGDPNCCRSSFGSKVACECAKTLLEDFYKTISEKGYVEEFINNTEFQQKLFSQLITSIVFQWRDIVNEDYNNNPLSEEERQKCDKYLSYYDAGKKIEHIYGTTLIAGLLTKDFLLLLQQGDGRCDVFDKSGKVSQPIPWDDKCFANVTTSLSDEDSVERFRYCLIDISVDPIIAVIAGTDGVEDSYISMDLMHCYYRDLLKYACENNIEELNKYLSETLPEFSKSGSGDDVTICGFINIDQCREFTSFFEKENLKIELQSQIKSIDDRMKSMNGMGKTDALTNNLKTANDFYDKAKSEQEIAKKEFDERIPDLKEAIEANTSKKNTFHKIASIFDYVLDGGLTQKLKDKVDDLTQKLENANAQLEEAKQKRDEAQIAFDSHMTKYNQYADSKIKLINKLNHLDKSNDLSGSIKICETENDINSDLPEERNIHKGDKDENS